MPKILICTVDSWNSKLSASSSNTFSALFSQYDAGELANIYIREELPDSRVCSRYFQISEQRVIKSLLKPKVKTGREVQATEEMSEADREVLEKANELYGRNRAKRSYLKLFIRELIWLFGGWKTKELKAFLEDFAPDVVIYSMEGYIHFNRLCRYAVKHTGAKAIGYFWDDNFTYKQLKSFGYKALRFFQRRSLKKLAKNTDCFWAITPKTKKEADSFFGIDSVLLTKPADMPELDFFHPKTPELPLKIVYTGNLAIGRASTIVALSKELDKLNSEGKSLMELEVYTPTALQPHEAQALGKTTHIHPPVPMEEVVAIQQQADILLFAEDIDGPLSKKARLSFSTKITDYFKAGKCILALGNADTAPMEYFRETDSAICVTDKEELGRTLRTILQNPQMLHGYARRAYQCGLENHNGEKIRQTVARTVKTVLEDC